MSRTNTPAEYMANPGAAAGLIHRWGGLKESVIKHEDMSDMQYQVSTEDRTINPELQRFLAKRMNATTIELKSSHVSLLSHPREIAELILAAAGHKA